MINKLNLLGNGCKNVDFPIYMKQIELKNGYLSTYNGTNFVHLKHDFGFEGLFNYYIFSQLIKKFPKAEISTDENNNLIIKHNKFVTELPLLPTDEFINYETLLENIKELDFIFIDNSVLTVLKLAYKIYEKAIIADYKYIYISPTCLISTDGINRILYLKYNFNIKEPFGITRQVVSLIDLGSELGTIIGNSVIKRPEGVIVSSVESVEKFPAQQIQEMIDKLYDTDNTFVCEFYKFQEIIGNLKPLSLNESIFNVKLVNKNNTLTASYLSATNGTAEESIESDCDIDFEMYIDGNKILDVDIDLDMCYNNTNRLVLFNKEIGCTIILNGVS